MDTLIVALLWIVFSIVAGSIAYRKGRSDMLYFFFSMFLSPAIGIILALLITPDPGKIRARRMKKENLAECGQCMGLVMRGVKKCKHCGSLI